MFNIKELEFYIIKSIAEGIILFDETYHVIFANNAALTFLGEEKQTIRGKSAESLFSISVYNQLFLPIQNPAIVEIGPILIQFPSNIQIEILASRLKDETPNTNINYYIVILRPKLLVAAPKPDSNFVPKNLIKTHLLISELIIYLETHIKALAVAKNLLVNIKNNSKDNMIVSNSEQIQFVLMNILSKLVNFCDQGNIIVTFSETSSGNATLITFCNPQQKMRKEDHETLIHTFEKGTDQAKNIVEAHGGRLWLETKQGIEFGLTIPKTN